MKLIPAGWVQRDWRAFVALMASIGGAVALTGFSASLALMLWRGGWPVATAPERIAVLGKALILSLGLSGIVMMSLGFAINRRSMKVTRDGFDLSGGEPPASATVTTTTTVAAPMPTIDDGSNT